MFNECGYVIFLLLLIPYIESARRLSEYVSHYEPLSYDNREIHANHLRVRRSISRERPAGDAVHIQFHALGRHFKLRLRRDTDTFNDRLRVEGPTGNEIQVDTAHIYQGHLTDDPNSYVFGSVIDGVFEGKIVSSDGAYYVEKAHHYFPKDQTNQSFHSVIYNENHVEDPHAHRRGHATGCGVTDEVIQWMERIQNSAVEEEEQVEEDDGGDDDNSDNDVKSLNFVRNDRETGGDRRNFQTASDPRREEANRYYYEQPFDKYSREANVDNSGNGGRYKRAAPKENKRNTCSLFIQTDPLIWRHIREGFPEHRDPSKRLEIDEKTREEILSLIAHHVTAVNYIYRDTKFDGKIEHRDIKFEVQRIKIDDDSACGGYPYRGEANPFCMENIDVSNFLNLHSLGNHEDFCLAYVFTYRDFTGGTLGLAWVASASGASGGICEKYKTYTETVGGTYQSTKRSLNTGIITFVNYNSRVPPKVSQLTLAHEIGHNFGSPHDYPPECRPGGLNGNFIMFASATSGDRPNNSKFSHCSVGNISAVLDAIEDNKKRNCFSASAGAFCGNKIVEAGEECDCGYDDDECTDKCCYPRIISELERIKNESAKRCHRKYGTQCSPSQGPCCQSTCRFVPGSARSVCKEPSDCSYSSQCNGLSAECPPPLPVADKTRCNNGTQLCIKGECAGSICLEWNLTECFLTSNIIPNINKRKLCELACQNGTDPSTCRSTSEFAHLVGLPPGGISLRPGSPCDNFQGYCDVFFKCRAVDAEGPLVRLKNLLLNKETLISVAQWVTEFWWAVLLMSIAFIIFMGAFIKCCAVHTPSSNPKKPPARRISDTLRRPMNTLRRMHRHHHHHHPGGPQPTSRTNPGHRAGSSRPSASRAPPHGYGEGRGQYYPPKGDYYTYSDERASYKKASAPPTANYNRSNLPDLYADAYEMHRQNQHKV